MKKAWHQPRGGSSAWKTYTLPVCFSCTAAFLRNYSGTDLLQNFSDIASTSGGGGGGGEDIPNILKKD